MAPQEQTCHCKMQCVCQKEWIVAICYRLMLTTRDSTATFSLLCFVQEIWGDANFTKPFGEVTTAPSLHWSYLICYVNMSKWYRLRKWGSTVNMKQGVAKKGACMLFPWINRGGDALTYLKCFAYPVHPTSYWFMLYVCSTVWPAECWLDMDRYGRKILK